VSAPWEIKREKVIASGREHFFRKREKSSMSIFCEMKNAMIEEIKTLGLTDKT
jgi:hypothetical protein